MTAEFSPFVRELFQKLDLPRGIAGELDWVSGLCRMNRSASQWEKYFSDPDKDIHLTRTLVHELNHYIQIASLGYLYRFAYLMYLYVASVVDEHYNDLSRIPENPEHLMDMQNLVWDLRAKELGQVSNLEIVEGLTYFVEVNVEQPMGPKTFLKHLESSLVGDTYKAAFRRFYSTSGESPYAAALFPAVCHASLCTWCPRESFDRFGTMVAKGVLHEKMTAPEFIDVCRRNGEEYYGFGWEFRKRGTIPPHPVYGRFEERYAQSGLVYGYFISPHNTISGGWIAEIARDVPIVFNPRPGLKEGFREWPMDIRLPGWSNDGPRDKRPIRLLYMAALARRYLGQIHAPPGYFVNLERLFQ